MVLKNLNPSKIQYKRVGQFISISTRGNTSEKFTQGDEEK